MFALGENSFGKLGLEIPDFMEDNSSSVSNSSMSSEDSCQLNNK